MVFLRLLNGGLLFQLLDAFLDGIGLEVTLDDILLGPLGKALA